MDKSIYGVLHSKLWIRFHDLPELHEAHLEVVILIQILADHDSKTSIIGCQNCFNIVVQKYFF
jgi:hypothetical protein